MAEINVIDYDEYQAIGFDAVLIDDQYNLHLVFFKLNQEDMHVVEETILYRTTIFTDDVQQMAEKIENIINLGMFDNLRNLAGGNILNSDFSLIKKVNWNDYDIACDPINSLPETKILH